ncbi:MerR family transcriptional regulator [Antrihabitans cavernicola]|uniref:MerR family transcriptional regulator n=2 Tax=Antrihabitans cavernicola TaxID=2495913 RepID=A0A5A7SCT5_9NOCA|nr:MerR family transcriptional regulator [Spelaeibacter cavernicola]
MLRGLAGVISPAPASEVQSAEYRIDDLASAAGVSVRNVRVYQDRGLLPPPRRQGRTGWYSESHLSRLNLIGRMLDRGYTFATISELLTAAQYGMRVEDVLDVEKLDVSGPGYGDTAAVNEDELRDIFGTEQFDENLQSALDGGLVKREGALYRVANARLLEAATLLYGAGVPMAEILAQAAGVRSDLRDVAGRFVKLVTDRYLPGRNAEPLHLDEQTVGEAAQLVNNARAMVHDVVQSLLVDAMEEAIGTALEQAAQRLATSADVEGPAKAG